MHIGEHNHLLHMIAVGNDTEDPVHDDHDDEKDVGSVLTAKTVTMVTLCLVSICMGIIPMQIAKYFKIVSSNQVINPRSFRYVNVLLGFGGGVLFCTTFLHMLPEVEEGVEHLMAEGELPHVDFSLAKIFCCTGFFVMYLIEEIVHAHLRHKHPEKPSSDATSKTSSKVNIYTTESMDNYGSVSAAKWKSPHHEETCEIGHTHLDIIEDCDSFHESAIRGLLIVLGLSVHELFEGLAIGLESSAGYVWYMFGAVAAHKFIIAFCIGVELITSRTRAILSYVYVCMFAVVSPLGIGIGMILVGGNSAAASGPAAVALQGLASGTLLYVVFFEILHKHRTGLLQYLSIILGFALMFGLQVLTAHSHEHGGHSHGDHYHGEEQGEIHNHASETLVGDKHNYVLGAAAIERVTDKVVDVLSTTLT
ncbi:zinc transporter ZIP1 isoform X3 [Phymastichus coffea]|uniref:zinc transporter ZIP1 isoform X3 n=1 Tax=Phymastichus coffea TaxID=108790 RepID=UPI00273B3AE8|nr:zinc transporter ZIP1 isoform X3 [Phymastichus coffea]XP_058798156.1 zinc transporter ZIP1 isoform X3 [Phymastichus coffea]XP_058798157.1 zinc transporter ZIP1 isoform X3 [Phymastichus coffea]